MRQGKNGVIHILSTMTHPCLHYRINEAWLLSSQDGHNHEQTGNNQIEHAQAEGPQKFSAQSKTASGGMAMWGYMTGGAQGLRIHTS